MARADDRAMTRIGTRTRTIIIACGGMHRIEQTIEEPVLGLRRIDPRPAHVRANQAPRSQRRA